MAKLTGQTIADSYDQLLIVDGASGITSSLQALESADTGGSVASLQVSTVAAAIDNPTASSATQGGKLTLFSDDGAALGDTHRLGVIEFSAAEDTSSTITIGARIEAIADAAWSASENGADMVFYTTDGNASQTEVLRLTADNLVGIGTAAPSGTLHVKAPASTHNHIYLETQTAGRASFINFKIPAITSGATNAPMGDFYWFNGADSMSVIGSNVADADGGEAYIFFKTQNDADGLAERVRIDEDGNVGIGQSTPQSDNAVNTFLHIGDSNDAESSLVLENSGNQWEIFTNSSNLYFADGTSTVIQFNNSQDAIFPNGNIIMGDGQGIDFSAKTPDESGAGSMSNEILDDYEEGTWDVSLTSDGGTAPTVSDTENMMTYTKIGRVVFISGQAGTCDCTGSTGALQLAGLPFDTISNQTDRAERVNLIANTQNDTYSHLILASTVGAGGSTLNISGKKLDGTMDNSVAGTMDGEGNFDLNIVGYYVTD